MMQLPYRIKPGYNGITITLPDNAIVADIGFGGDPVKRATYYVDMDLGESPQRMGKSRQKFPKINLCNATSMNRIFQSQTNRATSW